MSLHDDEETAGWTTAENMAAMTPPRARRQRQEPHDSSSPAWTQPSLDHNEQTSSFVAQVSAPEQSWWHRGLMGLHGLDGLIGTIALVYHAVQLHNTTTSDNKLEHGTHIGLIIWATLLVLRCGVGLSNTKAGWYTSGYIGWILAFTYFGLALSWGLIRPLFWKHSTTSTVNHIWQAILLDQPWLYHRFQWGVPTRYVWIPMILLALGECMRWALVDAYMVQTYFFVAHHDDEDEEQQQQQPLFVSPATSMRSTPWWWTNRNNNNDLSLDEPLIVEGQQRRQGQQPAWTSSLSPGLWHRWMPNSTSFAREEEEGVDFASVHEEWASRSQQDPLWWSRD